MATFTEDFTRMRQDNDQAQADRFQLIQDTHDWVQDKARGVHQLMQDMHDKTAEMARQLHTELKDFSTELHTGGSIFRKGLSSPKASRAKKGR